MNTDIVMDERKLRAALARAEAQIVALTETIDTIQSASGSGSSSSAAAGNPSAVPDGFSGTLGVPGGLSPAPAQKEIEYVLCSTIVLPYPGLCLLSSIHPSIYCCLPTACIL